MTIIDGYSHFCPDTFFEKLGRFPNAKVRALARRQDPLFEKYPAFTNVEKRLAELDEFNIAQQVAGLPWDLDPNMLPFTRAPPRQRLDVVRSANDGMSRAVKDSNSRLITLGGVDLSFFNNKKKPKEADQMRGEMKRAVKELGLKGFMVPSNVRGKAVDEFAPFWDEAAKLGAVVYIHPENTVNDESRPYEAEYDLMHAFGWPFETTLVLARLVLSGTMERHPNLKVLAHHLGGMIPFFAGRIVETYTKRVGVSTRPKLVEGLSKEPFEYFKLFNYDTAVGGSEIAVKCGYDVFGPDRLVFATDYPYGPNGGRFRLKTYPQVVEKLNISPEDMEKIFEKNVRRLLGF